MTYSWLQSRFLQASSSAALVLLAPQTQVLAQSVVIPDDTLGSESSTVRTVDALTQYIEGGAVRDSNLFHSFLEFNVLPENAVYFKPSDAIDNVLSRVTGNNPSNILGRLGMVGDANLWLMNPKGIVFGDRASLDIRGSFHATTLPISWEDRNLLGGAMSPASELLAISPETSFFNYVSTASGNTESGNIVTEGGLSTGENLTLSGQNLQMQGSLSAGSALSLLALDTITIRDPEPGWFTAQSGRNLTIQGNQGIDILALGTPGVTPFVSGGNIALLSDGIISGDSHFENTGTFSIESISGDLANLVSLYDPVISSTGDVDIAANYTGASLLIESQGSVRLQGSVDVTDPDTVSNFVGDDAVLGTEPGLIIRSGQSNLRYGGTDQNVPITYSQGSVPEGITLGGNVKVSGGIVRLTADSGGIDVQDISTSAVAGGGNISLRAAGDISTNGLNSSAFSVTDSVGNGGNISIVSDRGDITNRAGLISTSASDQGDAANAGDISILANEGDILTQDTFSYFLYDYSLDASANSTNGNGGNAGNITVISRNGSITNTGRVATSSAAFANDAGDGGDISLSATNGDINNNENLASQSYAQVAAAGDGGNITLSTTNGNIINAGLVEASSNTFSQADDAGDGGNIALSATNGNIVNRGNVSATTYSNENGNTGNGGSVAISAIGGDIINEGEIVSSSVSQAGNVGDGGDISLSAPNGNIINSNEIRSNSVSIRMGNASNGGNITISSTEGSIVNEALLSSESSSVNIGDASNGGSITISSTEGSIINNADVIAQSFSGSGNASDAGRITITSENNDIVNNGSLLARASTQAEVGTAGNGGDITISSNRGDITNNAPLSSSTFSRGGDVGDGGDISISAGEGDIVNRDALETQSFSFKGDTGNGGAIRIASVDGYITNDATLNSASFSNGAGDAGNGGDIMLSSEAGDITNNGSLSSESFSNNGSTGNGGAISLTSVSGDITNADFFSSRSISVAEEANSNAGNGGIILLSSDTGDIAHNSSLSSIAFANNGDSQDGGDISLLSPGGNIAISSDIFSTAFSIQGRTGSGGAVLIAAESGDIIGEDIELYTFAGSQAGSETNRGGTVTLRAQNALSGFSIFTLSTSGNSGTVNIEGLGDLRVSDTQLVTTNQVRIPSLEGNDTQAVPLTGVGQSGDVLITSPEGLTLDKVTIISDANTAIDAGDVTISSPGSIALVDSQITTATSSTGSGGNINVLDAETVTLDRTELTTSTEGEGIAGNIVVENVGLLLLRDDSLFLAEAAENADGGNIKIGADFVVSPPNSNSDIIANADSGTGGAVQITARGVYGFLEQSGLTTDELRGNRTSDISASSQFGSEGTVALNTLVRDPSEGLDELDDSFVTPNGLIAASCISRNNQVSGRFTIPGSGGLLATPASSRISVYPTDDVQLLPSTAASTHEIWQLGDPVIESESVAHLADGKIVFSRRCDADDSVSPH